MDQMALVGLAALRGRAASRSRPRLRADRLEPARRDRHGERRGDGEIVLAAGTRSATRAASMRDPTTGRLAVSTPGDLYAVGDGGIQWVDPATMTADPAGFFVTEDQLGGNITDFVVLSSTKAYAIVQRPGPAERASSSSIRRTRAARDGSSRARRTCGHRARAGRHAVARRPVAAGLRAPASSIPRSTTFVTAKPIDVGLPPSRSGSSHESRARRLDVLLVAARAWADPFADAVVAATVGIGRGRRRASERARAARTAPARSRARCTRSRSGSAARHRRVHRTTRSSTAGPDFTSSRTVPPLGHRHRAAVRGAGHGFR
jgi:hypothetical protein